MIRVPTQIARIIAGLWGVGIGYTATVTIPAWAHFLIVAGGVILAGLGIIPEDQAPALPAPEKSGDTPWDH